MPAGPAERKAPRPRRAMSNFSHMSKIASCSSGATASHRAPPSPQRALPGRGHQGPRFRPDRGQPPSAADRRRWRRGADASCASGSDRAPKGAPIFRAVHGPDEVGRGPYRRAFSRVTSLRRIDSRYRTDNVRQTIGKCPYLELPTRCPPSASASTRRSKHSVTRPSRTRPSRRPSRPARSRPPTRSSST